MFAYMCVHIYVYSYMYVCMLMYVCFWDGLESEALASFLLVTKDLLEASLLRVCSGKLMLEIPSLPGLWFRAVEDHHYF